MRSAEIFASHFFFFNDTATTEIYTLSLHDALPIFERECAHRSAHMEGAAARLVVRNVRSEEHTSELQSRRDLVCRLLLEKKNRAPRRRPGAIASAHPARPPPAAPVRAAGQGLAPHCAPLGWGSVCAYPFSFFFFNDPATPEIYPLSLHDALPISSSATKHVGNAAPSSTVPIPSMSSSLARSEEHTSELQSRRDVVCRLLLEK